MRYLILSLVLLFSACADVDELDDDVSSIQQAAYVAGTPLLLTVYPTAPANWLLGTAAIYGRVAPASWVAQYSLAGQQYPVMTRTITGGPCSRIGQTNSFACSPNIYSCPTITMPLPGGWKMQLADAWRAWSDSGSENWTKGESSTTATASASHVEQLGGTSQRIHCTYTTSGPYTLVHN